MGVLFPTVSGKSYIKFHGSSHHQPVYYPMNLSPISNDFILYINPVFIPWGEITNQGSPADFFIPHIRLVGDAEKYDVINGGNKWSLGFLYLFFFHHASETIFSSCWSEPLWIGNLLQWSPFFVSWIAARDTNSMSLRFSTSRRQISYFKMTSTGQQSDICHPPAVMVVVGKVNGWSRHIVVTSYLLLGLATFRFFLIFPGQKMGSAHVSSVKTPIWLVVLTCNHLEKWWSSSMGFGWHPIYEMENKPPTSLCLFGQKASWFHCHRTKLAPCRWAAEIPAHAPSTSREMERLLLGDMIWLFRDSQEREVEVKTPTFFE